MDSEGPRKDTWHGDPVSNQGLYFSYKVKDSKIHFQYNKCHRDKKIDSAEGKSGNCKNGVFYCVRESKSNRLHPRHK